MFGCVSRPAVEVDSLKKMLPRVVMSVRIEEYEHLDLMWADTASKTVFPKVGSRPG